MKQTKLSLRIAIAIVLHCVTANMTFAQAFDWAKGIKGTSGNYNAGYSVAVDAYGNVYTTGAFSGTNDFDPGAGTFNLTSFNSSSGNYDIFISKLDASGNLLWAKQMGGNMEDIGYSVIVDDFENVYITGTFNGIADFDPGIGVFNLTSAGGSDVFVSKLDSSGNLQWVKQIGGNNGDIGSSSVLDSVGNIYTTGNFIGTADFDPGAGTFNLTSAGNNDVFISKLDSSGNFIWAKQMGGIDYDLGTSSVIDAVGNILTTGTFYGIADFDPGMSTFYLTSTGSYDIFITKLDPSGNFLWAKQMGGAQDDQVMSLAIDTSGNIYTTGQFNGTSDFDPDSSVSFNLTSSGVFDIFISKLNPSGNFLWAKEIGGTHISRGNAIAVDAARNIFITGYFIGTTDFDPDSLANFSLTSVSTQDADIFITKLNPSGNFLWANQIGGLDVEVANSIAVDGSGNIYTTGIFESTVDFDPGIGTFNLIATSINDIFILKLKGVITTVKSSSSTNIQLYPNPTNGIINIELEENYKNIKLTVKNIIGETIQSKFYIYDNRIVLNIEKVLSGIYFIELQTDNENPAIMKIIKQ